MAAPAEDVVIGSLRGLVVLAAIAIAAIAAIVVVAVVPSSRAPVSAIGRRIAPDFSAGAIDHVRWQRGATTIEIDKGDRGWRWVGRSVAVDPGAVDELVAALRGGSWQRRDVASRAGTVHATITASARAIGVTFGIGEPLPGTEQVWLVAGDSAFLVDGWIAHALDPDPLALHVRRPFASVADAGPIAITETTPGAPNKLVTLDGHPRRIDGVMVDADRVAALEAALAALTIIGDVAPSAITPDDTHLAFRSGSRDVETLEPVGAAGACELVRGNNLEGCVSIEAWAKVVAAARALTAPLSSLVELRPAPVALVSIKLPDGMLDLWKRPNLDGHDLDTSRVADLMAALALPATRVALPTTKPTGTIEIREHKQTIDSGPSIALDLHDGVLVRRGEPFGLRPTPAHWATITRPASSYRDDALWLEEPTAIIALIVDRVTYRSGNVVGEWTREPAGEVDAAAIDAAVHLLAALRAPTATPLAGFAPRHRIEILVAAPSGPATTHVLEIGDGCIARAGDRSIQLAKPVCALVSLGR